MKIYSNGPELDPSIKQVRNKKKTDDSAKKAAHTVTGEDRVEFSQSAKDIQRAKKLLGSVPDIREEKVARIKGQIENGTYKIDKEKIALNMLKESLLVSNLLGVKPIE